MRLVYIFQGLLFAAQNLSEIDRLLLLQPRYRKVETTTSYYLITASYAPITCKKIIFFRKTVLSLHYSQKLEKYLRNKHSSNYISRDGRNCWPTYSPDQFFATFLYWRKRKQRYKWLYLPLGLKNVRINKRNIFKISYFH